MSTKSKSHSRLIAAIDALERRRLLTSSLSAGVLTITGTSGNNTIDVSLVSSKIRVKESGLADKNYTPSQVTKIVADGKAGNDKITINSNITRNTELRGGTGNDTIRGGGGVDALLGGDGNDNLEGGAKNDYLDGGKGNDTADYSTRTARVTGRIELDGTDPQFPIILKGYGGQSGETDDFLNLETMVGGHGSDVFGFYGLAINQNAANVNIALIGGPGKDILSADTGSKYPPFPADHVAIYGGEGNDALVSASNDSVSLYGESGNDRLVTNEGADDSGDYGVLPKVISGGPGTDSWELRYMGGLGGSQSVVMEPTVENLSASFLLDPIKITGNALGNQISVYAPGATIQGGAGNDTITGSYHPDTISGGDGNDVINGSDGNDSLDGDKGNDTIKGGTGDDYIQAGFGNDSVLGEAGSDTLDGDIGGFTTTNDYDTLDGGIGNDFIWATDTGHCTMLGGDGNDTLSGSGVSNVSDGGAGDDSITGTNGNDSITGGSGKDTISASKGNDKIVGGTGDDELHGDAGNDTILAGDGNDTLYGGAGDDSLAGENGNDILLDRGFTQTHGDTLNGGAGVDAAETEIGDTWTSIEELLP